MPVNLENSAVATVLGQAHWLKPPTLARHHSNHLHGYYGFTTGGPGKEHRTNKLPPTGRVQERSKGDTMCQTTSKNPSHWPSSWLSNAGTTRKDSESDWLIRDNPETIPITIKPKTVSHMAEQFSWVPLPLLSAWVLLPNKIFFLVSTCISSDSSFLSVRQELNLGPGKVPLLGVITLGLPQIIRH